MDINSTSYFTTTQYLVNNALGQHKTQSPLRSESELSTYTSYARTKNTKADSLNVQSGPTRRIETRDGVYLKSKDGDTANLSYSGINSSVNGNPFVSVY